MLVVIKIGTDSVLENIPKISTEISKAMELGHKVVLVSSGAVGFGRSINKKLEKTTKANEKQLLASIGQVKLILEYEKELAKFGYTASQILLTKQNLTSKNKKSVLDLINLALSKKIVPIINENDCISNNEIMFTDNDELAGLLASELCADILIILTNVDGVYDDFTSPNRKVLSKIYPNDSIFINEIKSTLGRGGMKNKVNIASKLGKFGIQTVIANVANENCIPRILNNEEIGTRFIPAKILKRQKRNLIFNCENEHKGEIVINKCLEDILKSGKNISILPIGVTKCIGDFEKSNIINIKTQDDELIGYGKASISAKDAIQNIGKEHKKPIIRREVMYIL